MLILILYMSIIIGTHRLPDGVVTSTAFAAGPRIPHMLQ